MKDIKEQVAKSREIALFCALGDHTWYTIFEMVYVTHDEHYAPLPDGQRREIAHEGYVRVSETFKLSFSSLSDDTIVQNAVESLNEAERKAIEELNTKIAKIREQKSQLLALTHQS